MADEKFDPTDESDASAARDEGRGEEREPIGRELLEHGPDHVESLGDSREGDSREDDTGASAKEDEHEPGGATAAEFESDELARAEAEVAEDDGDGIIDEGEAALAASRVSRRPVRRSAGSEVEPTPSGRGRKPSRKSGATPRQKRGSEHHRTGPVQFVNESVGELRKVVWPTGEQVRGYFAVVLVFVLFIIAFVGLLDLGYGWVILKVFG